MGAQPEGLRRGALCGQLAYAACGSLVGLATGKSHRKPVLCGGGEPCGSGPVLRVLRRHVDDRPLRTYGSGLLDAVTVEVDRDGLADFRRKFPVLDDADDFTLNI